MPDGLERLLLLLDLEEIDRNLYRGANPGEGGGRVFGGQVASQALRAAGLTVEVDHRVNSLHSYFLRPGKPAKPIVYSVDRIRDGKSFTTRRVVAIQDGEAIFNLEASFHRDEPGRDFQQESRVDRYPPPEQVERDPGHHYGPHRRAIDFREVDPVPPSTRVQWLRAEGRLPDDPLLHACVLVYASDSGPVGAARRPIRGDDDEWSRFMSASLDHTVWFHRPVRADEWLLYDLEAVACAGARGLARGLFFTRQGLLVASVNQEALLRPLGT